MKLRKPESLLALLGMVLFSAVSVGCATVDGIGEDIEEIGDEIEDEVDD